MYIEIKKFDDKNIIINIYASKKIDEPCEQVLSINLQTNEMKILRKDVEQAVNEALKEAEILSKTI